MEEWRMTKRELHESQKIAKKQGRELFENPWRKLYLLDDCRVNKEEVWGMLAGGEDEPK